MTYTINQIQDEMTSAGSNWWDLGTMRYFKCRVSEQVYQGPGGIYFVTSEKSPYGPRAYTVRQYLPGRKQVETVGDFNSMTRAAAHRHAARLSQVPLQEQLDEAICNLDRAVTGKDKSGFSSKYGSIDDTREGGSRGIVYLSDGGYTRFVAEEYETGGYHLNLITTFPDEEMNEEIRSKWSKAYELRQEVCRILETEPAGDLAVVSKQVHSPIGTYDQLIIDIERGGGKCTLKQAKLLVSEARKHHKIMEDYCNGLDPYDADGEPGPRLNRNRTMLEKLASECGCGVVFSGDPRGCTVKLVLPNGKTNDWGKEGWCIPTGDDE